ncbi:MAG: SDR family NAD(P)-dependent oxidoreductase [Deltaproteobacteria bacterium]|nr:SDR family NAD(P)-dependent oxidoreductase [Deltaproteobacteria bacterium]MBW2382550.1 SDR family NAD(P)-dependent oxidoreductase [Deltaproteobacteria bacterium]MBW2695656.1 SDR family NAD(P)-dependent oxidoreductase [Deltaproteobacteria bacterium]
MDAFVENGDRVVVPWIVEAEAKAMPKHELIELIRADVSEPDGAEASVQAAGMVDVLVNGVGGFGGGTPVHETEIALWDRLYRINVRTAVCMSAAAATRMTSGGGGVIVNVASQASVDCPAGIAAYSASKAAIVVLTRSLQAELGDAGVRVNAVMPTTIDTPANREAMPDADFSTWTAPEEIARVIVWLASEAGRTVRGGLIPV